MKCKYAHNNDKVVFYIQAIVPDDVSHWLIFAPVADVAGCLHLLPVGELFDEACVAEWPRKTLAMKGYLISTKHTYKRVS